MATKLLTLYNESPVNSLVEFIRSDVRILQIFLMGTLLSIGVFFRDFSILPLQIGLTFLAGILTQFLWMRILKIEIPYFSTIITCLGLSLLLRSDYIWVHPLISFTVNSSKFIIRVRGKHIFNPAMLGVILGISFLPGTWVSPGQWGYELTVGIWLIAFGFIVSGRARISEISYAFLFFYFSLLAYRIINFGYRWDVLFHQLQNGALILFAFFMITDPKTIPNHKIARILHALLVACVAYAWAFQYFKTNNLIWALFLCSPVVILWDLLFKEKKYEWGSS
ncbi:MAG: RnfABCDGE type electron transport complex subunit D [Leptospiraceae bacterium]|nr:RnfABCDGE type electron transport complex subunit D [Leptospiraceae bacterium]